jgi:hypothetical protein
MTQVDTATGMYIFNRALKEFPIIGTFLVMILANLSNFSNILHVDYTCLPHSSKGLNISNTLLLLGSLYTTGSCRYCEEIQY